MLEVRLHGALWKQATPIRRHEWQRALDELNEDNALSGVAIRDADEASIEIVRTPDDTWHLRLMEGAYSVVDTIDLDAAEMQPHLDEYAATIRKMVHVDRDAPVRGFEALDYAKRVVHDDAGTWLSEKLAGRVRSTHDDARRLFTLLFLLISELPEEMVRYHRVHGAR